MVFEQLNDTACKTYLIASEQTKEAMLVDPVLEEVDHYLEILRERGLELRYVVDTHVHADHISGAATLRDRTGVDYIMHHNSISSCANVRVGEGDVVTLGELEFHVLHTPGHTQDSRQAEARISGEMPEPASATRISTAPSPFVAVIRTSLRSGAC